MISPHLILIAGGCRARLLRQDSQGRLMELYRWDSQRSRAGFFPGPAFEQGNLQRRAESFLVSRIAKDLKEKISGFEHLILVAPLQILKELRTELDDHLLARVERQMDRDWTHLSLQELPAQIERALSAKR